MTDGSELGQIARWAVAWGPGLLILAGLYLLVRRPPAFVGEFIKAQVQQAVAMTEMASAVKEASSRAGKIDELLINSQVTLRREEEILRRLEERDYGAPASRP